MWNNILRSSLTYKMNEEPFVNLCENILDLENEGALIERENDRKRAAAVVVANEKKCV